MKKQELGVAKCNSFLLIGLLSMLFTSSCNLLPFGEILVSKATSESAQPAGTIFFDDFSSSTSGWDRMESDLGGTDYMDGGYHILVDEVNTDYFSTLYRTYSDVSLQVNGWWVEGPYDNNYGLICRYQDEKNFYAGMITTDGYYGIFKVENGIYQVLGHDNMVYSDLILGDENVNTIKLDCFEDFLILYVNENLLDVQQDDTFSSGDIGLIAGSFENAGVHIAFDDFYLIDPALSSN